MGKCISKKETKKLDVPENKNTGQGLLHILEKVAESSSREEHYKKLDDTAKNITYPDGGFFAFPHAIKGETKPNIRKTIVFYFDTEEEYEIATNFSDKNKSFHKLPYMDTSKLMKLLENKK